MKMAVGAFLILAMAISSSLSSQELELSPADLKQIRSLDEAYVSAWLSNDTLGVLNILSPDAVLIPTGMQPITGMQAIKQFWFPNDGSQTLVTHYTNEIAEIHGGGHFAYVIGRADLRFTYEKDGSRKEYNNRNISLTILQRGKDNQWRITRRMWTALP
jgi:uncharacterized protein (TIGR02246 family)